MRPPRDNTCRKSSAVFQPAFPSRSRLEVRATFGSEPAHTEVDLPSSVYITPAPIFMKHVQLIYCSQVTGRLSLDIVQAILKSAAKNNPARGLTGFLAFNERNFLQVIEGGTSAINLLFNSIYRDHRHHGVHLISFREIAERQFPHFAMGDCNLETVDTSAIERYVDSAVFDPAKLSAEAALGLLQALEAQRRAEAAPNGL